ncbi:Sulfotransferase domain [Trinorchestia longiramus]|nr:Sulfotransferase domain [Trinorchestia longiramus]
MFQPVQKKNFSWALKILTLSVITLLVLCTILSSQWTASTPGVLVPSVAFMNLSSSSEVKFDSPREDPVLNSGIPDHPPFQLDFQSAVVSFPWINDSACQNYEVRLGVNIPPVYLLSFPRSGNSWTRYLVEGATGIFTGSVYNDKTLYKMGYLGEREKPTSKKVLLIKDHLLNQKDLKTDLPVVLLIRNPRNAVASYSDYKTAVKLHKENQHLYRKPKSSSTEEEMRHKILTMISWWEQVATKALTSSTLLVLLYEDIKADPITSVKKILSFLKMTADEKRLQCLARNVKGKVNRGQPEFSPFTAEQEAHFKNATRRVSDLLKSRGMAPLPYPH